MFDLLKWYSFTFAFIQISKGLCFFSIVIVKAVSVILPVRSLNSAGLGGGVLEALGDKRSEKKENLKFLT